MRIAFVACLLIGHILSAHAQSSSKEAALGKLQQLVNTYQQAGGLSFDVLYRYASETAPNQSLDSMHGQFKVKGNKYWYTLEGMESMCNEQYQVVLFREDSLLYLSRPNPKQAMAINPMASLDSFLRHNKNISFELQEDNAEYRIVLELSQQPSQAGTTYFINKKTGFLTKTISKVPAEQLYDPSVRALVQNGQSTYAIVEVLFSHYQVGGLSDSLFDNARYFIKQGDEYRSVPPYETYRVFKGSADL